MAQGTISFRKQQINTGMGGKKEQWDKTGQEVKQNRV